MKNKDSIYIPIIVVLSIVIPIAVAGLMFMPEEWHLEFGGADLRSLPFLHAILNGCTALLLFTGFILIKNDLSADKVLDTFFFNDILYVSYSNKVP